jgi:uncharacterized OsmC-like protein
MSDSFEITLERIAGYRFRTDFGVAGIPPLVVDEPPPLGENAGPNPARLLAAAIGDCLSASLIFCLAKARVEVGDVDVRVVGTFRRNERKRLRIGGLDVTIEVDTRGADPDGIGACLEAFEDFCVVTASVRKGIDVTVTVFDAAGNRLFANPAAQVG